MQSREYKQTNELCFEFWNKYIKTKKYRESYTMYIDWKIITHKMRNGESMSGRPPCEPIPIKNWM